MWVVIIEAPSVEAANTLPDADGNVFGQPVDLVEHAGRYVRVTCSTYDAMRAVRMRHPGSTAPDGPWQVVASGHVGQGFDWPPTTG